MRIFWWQLSARRTFVTADMVKEGAVVIDVGMNRNATASCAATWHLTRSTRRHRIMTPVPGGAGPMTITMLMKNTLKAAKLQNGIR